MRTVFSGELWVHYGQFYMESRPDCLDVQLWDPFAGQSNGLCGAAVPGYLFLTTGLHTGRVGLTIEVHDTAPSVGEQWEDVAEVHFRPASPSTDVLPWGEGSAATVDLPVRDHRLRYCALGMDRAREEELAVLAGDLIADHYLLQFWPAPPGPDQVIRETTQQAAYWHQHARSLPPPPTPQELAEAEHRRQQEEERATRAAHDHAETLSWGGRLPTERLR